jgi:hypothetical protein
VVAVLLLVVTELLFIVLLSFGRSIKKILFLLAFLLLEAWNQQHLVSAVELRYEQENPYKLVRK